MKDLLNLQNFYSNFFLFANMLNIIELKLKRNITNIQFLETEIGFACDKSTA